MQKIKKKRYTTYESSRKNNIFLYVPHKRKQLESQEQKEFASTQTVLRQNAVDASDKKEKSSMILLVLKSPLTVVFQNSKETRANFSFQQ